jgi:N-acyl-D-amino-acid deacylase
MDFDIVIKNGRIIDGSGNPWFKANIGIKDGKIAKINRLPLNETAKTIDAEGLVVCPGFFDLHSHSDFSIMIHNKAESSLHMGLTTMGVGQCGSDSYTLIEEYKQMMKIGIASFARVPVEDVEVDWSNLAEWREKLEKKGIGANLAPYVGFGNLRTCVMGVEGKGGERYTPTEDELEKMKSILDQQMRHGAFGLSTGLVYSEQRNASTEEIVELAKVVAKHGGIYISHMRGEDDTLIEACKELIAICEKAGVRGCFSHHKAMFPENWGKPCETMRLIDRARAKGIEIYCDQYCQPYAREANLGSWFISYLMGEEMRAPPSVDELIKDMKNLEKWEEIKKKAIESYEKDVEKNEERKKVLGKHGIKVPAIWNPATFDYVVYSKTHPDFVGKNFTEVAEAMGIGDFWDAIRDLYIADDGNTYVAAGGMCEEDIITILKHPASSVSTDDWSMDWVPPMRYPTGLLPHPRGYGVYAKVLGRYVRDMKILRLEEAIRKMASLPAQFLDIKDRGMIREGYWADIVLFNPKTVKDLATFEKPATYPEGIPYVLVNGQIVISEGKHIGALPGKVLFHKA